MGTVPKVWVNHVIMMIITIMIVNNRVIINDTQATAVQSYASVY